jgi:CheY-like chemotaxis protein
MMKSKGTVKALIVDDESNNRPDLTRLLGKQGYQTIAASTGQQAVDLFRRENPDIVFMGVVLPEMDGCEATRRIKAASGDRFVPVIFLTSSDDQAALSRCIDAGGDDFLLEPYDDVILQSKIRSMQRIAALHREVRGMYSMIHREQEIAESVFVKAIQSSNIDNPHLRQVVRPANIFSGDMVLSAYSPARDLYFLTGDFTGHGLLAALGAMPVSEVFRAMIAKGFGPEEILSGINSKLKTLLPTGMFFAALLVVVNHDLEHVRVFNAGMPELLIIDGRSHRIKHRLASTGLPLGIEANLDIREMPQFAPIAHDDKILMYSDGLIESVNTDDEQFGSERLLQAIAAAPRKRIFGQILDNLDAYCGARTQSDDVTLVEIDCVHDVLPRAQTPARIRPSAGQARHRGEWTMSLRFDGAQLRESSPVPILVDYLMEMEDLQAEKQSLFTVLSELYVNALDHGVLGLDSALKNDAAGLEAYYRTRENRLAGLDSGYVRIELSVQQSSGRRSIGLRVEDSGEGFDLHGASARRGLDNVRQLCESLDFEDNGRIAVARFSWDNA